MSSESIQETVNELRETRSQVEKMVQERASHVQQLELQVQALRAELDSVNEYYGGINGLLDRLASVKGAPQQQRVALEILELRNRKRGIRRVVKSTE